jgi:hypothetical protein
MCRNDKPRSMGPGVRRDDDIESYPAVPLRIAVSNLSAISSAARSLIAR